MHFRTDENILQEDLKFQNNSIRFLWVWQFPDNLEGLQTIKNFWRKLECFADSVEKNPKILEISYLKIKYKVISLILIWHITKLDKLTNKHSIENQTP